MKCRGMTSQSHRLEMQHMVLMRAGICRKFLPAPADRSSDRPGKSKVSLQLASHGGRFQTRLLLACSKVGGGDALGCPDCLRCRRHCRFPKDPVPLSAPSGGTNVGSRVLCPDRSVRKYGRSQLRGKRKHLLAACSPLRGRTEIKP